MKTQEIYFGAAYYDEYMPASRVDTDMELMVQAHMNVIRIAESTWSTWEPEDGRFDFTSLHRVLDAAGRHGIRVIVGTPTYAIPPWLARKYPDILAETHAGPNRYGPRQNMDLTHPGYRFHSERIIRKLMEQVCDCPQVIGYQLDNETKPYDTCSPRAQAQFKAWLQRKFGTVEAMNQAFGLRYWSNSLGSWDDLPDVRGTINGSLAAEYAAFQRSLVEEFFAFQRKIVDEYRRPDQFVTHNFDFAWKPFQCNGLQTDVNQFAAAQYMTVAGCDIYHPTAADLTGMEISFGSDLTRGLKRGENYLVLETQAQGPICNFPYPGQLRLHALSHLAGGANMIEYWHWHSIHTAIESHWKGILSHDLQPGATYREIAAIGADLHRLGPKLVNLRRKSPIAFLVSNRSATAVQNDASFSGLDYNAEMFDRIYRALYRMNLSCDILNDNAQDFSGYELVVVPCLYSATDALIDALRGYVAGGGRLLATYRSFFTDEYAAIRHAPQPYRMTDVFGMTYDQFYLGKQIPDVDGWMELLRPEVGTEALRGYENTPYADYAAVTLHPFGSGQAAYLGARYTQEALEAALETLLPRLGVALPEQRWPLIHRWGVREDGHALHYLFNYSDTARTQPCPVTGTELLTGKSWQAGEPLPLEAWGAAILETESPQ